MVANKPTHKEPTVAETNTAPAAETGVKNLMIAGVNFTAPYKYIVGHVLSDAEARTLNQTRFENLRNNFAGKVKASVDGVEGALTADQLVAAFAEFEAAYTFSMPGVGVGASRTLDPIEREAQSLARDLVKQALAAKGRSYNPPKDATDEQKETYKTQIAGKVAEIATRDEVVAQAKKNVAARDKGLSAIAATLDL
jgi:hypothetical protein